MGYALGVRRAQSVVPLELIAQNAIMNQAEYERPEFYNAFGFGGNNCATFVTGILRAAGIQVPATRIPEFVIPRLQVGGFP